MIGLVISLPTLHHCYRGIAALAESKFVAAVSPTVCRLASPLFQASADRMGSTPYFPLHVHVEDVPRPVISLQPCLHTRSLVTGTTVTALHMFIEE